MADRPIEKKETAKKDEAYQPLWDTDQSVPEYMTLLMDQQTQKNEDATLHQASDNEDEELEHPDPDYEYVYPGAPKRYDSARKDSHDTDDNDTDDIEEPEDDASEDTPEDTHESRKDDDANHPVALASTQPAQSAQSAGSAQPVFSARERAQAMQTQATQAQTMHAYGEYVQLESLGLSPGAILPVIPDLLFGTPTQNSSKCACSTAPTTSPHPCRRAPPT